MRLDIHLVMCGLAKSRARAQALVKHGAVLVDGTVVTKPAFEVAAGHTVQMVEADFPYVSRGALKLKALLSATGQHFINDVVLDAGASTGGFTEVALEQGARLVYAVDVGSDQLALPLRQHAQVVVMEKTDARQLPVLTPPPQALVSDVSFISQTKVLPPVLCRQQAVTRLFILVKPQFELSPAHIGKGGVVKNDSFHQQACDSVSQCVAQLGFRVVYLAPCPVVGSDGNQEYLLFAQK